jgi:Flp pilus assembly CpaE family ATPase
VLLVAGLSLPCLINVKKLVKIFRELGYPPEPSVEVVINRFDRKSVITLREAEQSTARRHSGGAQRLQRHDERHQPGQAPVGGGARAEVTEAIAEMAAALAGRHTGGGREKEKEKRAFLGLKLY